MKDNRAYKYLRLKLKYGISNRKIHRARRFYDTNSLNVMSPSQTLELIKNRRKSFVRIGDGEMYCLMNQMKNKTSNNNLCDNFMRDYLRMILKNEKNFLLIGLLSGPYVSDNVNSPAKISQKLKFIRIYMVSILS